MKNPTIVAAAFAGIALASCDQTGPKTPATGGTESGAPVSRDDAAVLVNGRAISKFSVENLEQEFGQRRGGESIDKEKIIDELTKREILRQEAEKDKLLDDPAVAAKVDNATRMVLSQAAAENWMKKFVPTEEEIKREYEERIGATKSDEYRVRHILVNSEKEALEVIKRLQKGEDFGALAKKFSKDPGSKDSGGDLGWLGAQQMVPEFAGAVAALKNGETTKVPVETDFGWHVVRRENSRERQPPALDAVKEQLVSFMQSEKLHEFIGALQAKAKIERLLPAESQPIEGRPATSDPDKGAGDTEATPKR